MVNPFYGRGVTLKSQPAEYGSQVARMRDRRLAVIAVGGMLGAAARFKLAEALPAKPVTSRGRPSGPTCRAASCWASCWSCCCERFPPTRYVRPFLATGILGAYTTMSTYAVETALLIKDGHAATALLYGLGSVAAGVFLAYAGIVVARLTVVGTSQR